MSDHEDLESLLADAALIPVTPEDREEQRRSFAHGNVSMSNPEVTREMIDKAADELAAEDLARRLVAHERWVWRPGMLAVDGSEGFEPADLSAPLRVVRWDREPLARDWLPDLTDHATQGCLLGMLREMCTEVKTASECDHNGIESHEVLAWVGDGPAPLFDCPTLGEALARALLAAWGTEREETPA